MPELIRVKQRETGHELSVPLAHYQANEEGYAKVNRPAAYPDGSLVEPKPKTTVAKSAAAKKKATSGRQADSKKETA